MVSKLKGGMCWHIEGMRLNRTSEQVACCKISLDSDPFSHDHYTLRRSLRTGRKPTKMSKFAPHRRSGNNPRATSSTICQKCLRTGSSPRCVAERFAAYTHRPTKGHFTYECKDARPYVSRPSRTAQLANPQLLADSKVDGGNPSSVDVPDEFKNKFVCPFFVGTC
jgi:hypothetical protein